MAARGSKVERESVSEQPHELKLIAMKDKHEKHKHKASSDKDVLSQQDLIAGTSTFSFGGQPHSALETPEGKNNGAEPAVYQNQRKAQT